MTTEEKFRYFKELALNLRQEGFTADQTEEELLSVALDGRQLCLATDSGGVRYWREHIDSEARSAALDRVTTIVKTTAEYMGQMETAPQLTVGRLKGDFRLLADFNDTVLAGHPTKYGMQFITWDRTNNRTSLNQGNYYGPYVGIDSYTAAKQDFATRSGLISRSALFTPEQMREIYLCVDLEMDGSARIRDERLEILQGVKTQLESLIPDIAEQAEQSFLKDPDMENTPRQDQSFNM